MSARNQEERHSQNSKGDECDDFESWRSIHQQRLERALFHYLPSLSDPPETLHRAMHYALAGGKRMRPLLCFAAASLNNQAMESEKQIALDRSACALEMLHTYSLVHDDLPCMDNDNLRRGQATVHKKYNEATAILVGDALQTQAFTLLAGIPNSQHSVFLIKQLAQASGSLGMVGGQAIDMAAVGHHLSLKALETMHQMKTGALIRAAILMGAFLADEHLFNTPELERQRVYSALVQYADNVGLAFQITDDILDATAKKQLLGKTVGKDAAQQKPNYVSLLGLEQAKASAFNLYIQARDTLSDLGAGVLRLKQILEWAEKRQY